MAARAETTLAGPEHAALRRLARAIHRRFPVAPLHDFDALQAALLESRGFRRLFAAPDASDAFGRSEAWDAATPDAVRLLRIPVFTTAMHPQATAAVPLDTPGALADFLGVSGTELDWLADLQGRNERPGEREGVRHYRVVLIRGRGAGARPRCLEVPKGRLRALQRKLLRAILDPVPVHAAATAFHSGASVIDHAARHAGREIVVRIDLKQFFPSITRARVEAVFAGLGYPRAVARLLAGLCTHRTRDPAVLPESRARFRVPHLPQGAPTSPALSNLVARRLDVRLTALAETFGATYSRYADDLTFSGDAPLVRDRDRLVSRVFEIVCDEGFEPNPRKTLRMRAGRAQRVTGLVVNAHPNVPRAEYDRLKAILHRCCTDGAEAQNRDAHPDFRAHLLGRIAWVAATNPRRGEKLRAAFARIDWSSPGA